MKTIYPLLTALAIGCAHTNGTNDRADYSYNDKLQTTAVAFCNREGPGVYEIAKDRGSASGRVFVEKSTFSTDDLGTITCTTSGFQITITNIEPNNVCEGRFNGRMRCRSVED